MTHFRFILILSVIAFLTASNIKAQKIRLGKSINSYQPVILPVSHPDGSILYLDRKYHPDNIGAEKDKDEIVYAQLNDVGAWGELNRAFGNANSSESDVLHYIFPSGKKGIVSRTNDDNRTELYLADINNDLINLEEKIRFDSGTELGENFYVSVTPDLAHMILSYGSDENTDLYYSENKNSIWSRPVKINVLNTDAPDESPYISADAKTIYFSSNRVGTSRLDIYMSKRSSDNWLEWSKPQILDQTINSEYDDYGLNLVFGSNDFFFVSGDTTNKRKGIYKADLEPRFQPEKHFIIHYEFEKGLLPYHVNAVFLKNGAVARIQACNGPRGTAVLNSLYDSFYLESDHGVSDTLFLNEIDKTEIQSVWLNFNSLENQKLIIKTFHYSYNSSRLSAADISELKEAVNSFKSIKTIEISGYADSTGSNEYNMRLGLKRAANVKKILTDLGISRAIIEHSSMGEENYNYKLSDAENRKVEIKIIP